MTAVAHTRHTIHRPFGPWAVGAGVRAARDGPLEIEIKIDLEHSFFHNGRPKSKKICSLRYVEV